MIAYIYLDEWHLTPMDMGTPVGEVDPVYGDAMLLIRAGHNREQERQMKKSSRKGGGRV